MRKTNTNRTHVKIYKKKKKNVNQEALQQIPQKPSLEDLGLLHSVDEIKTDIKKK